MHRTDDTVEPGPSGFGLQDIITIDSDSVEPDISSCIPSTGTLDGIDLAARVKEFSERHLNSLPLNLMAADFKNYYFYKSNQRLEETKASGVDLDDIAVGDDCLLTWCGRTWDPAAESLHDIIQSRLATRDEAQQAGNLVREDIIWKTGVKLYEASGMAAEDAIRYLHHRDEDELHTPDDDENCTLLSSDLEAEQPYGTGVGSLSQSTTLMSSDDSTSLSFVSFSFSDRDSGIDSESDPDIGPDDVDDFDDTFSVDNMFDPEPLYPDSDDEELNIFHGARVVGVQSQYANVDLEIYEASDEDDVEDLPEMELCIDGQLYEELFDIEEVVGAEIEGSRIICTGELFEEGDEIIVDDPKDEVADSGYQQDEDGSALESPEEIPEGQMFRQRFGTGDEAISGSLSKFWESLDGEQATQRENSDSIFRDTEDGFMW
ncbi:hypothetical protein FVEN_g7459 [Fusarium venenatum]|uniref:Uncharacterized protein n=1 Tax=Fusarium venenatum TaxID=56646 RepID=A0A2L2T7I9_9HYPO|nr:uncharacterized protein FVRRES_02380 [Fusarium venenatum]KAG8354567.1 hypothetical protein FVEN_g7459 [Fusarium venenatum]CEI65868.1 unnamed protein product [Fusarium venenatum]